MAQGPSLHGRYPLPRYYDPSDFLSVLLASSLGPLVRQYFPLGKNAEDLPRSHHCFKYMPCSSTPEMFAPPAHERWSEWCLRAFRRPRPPRKSGLTGLNRFSLPAYGLHPPCLRLTHGVTAVRPRLGMECVGSTLFPVALAATSSSALRGAPKMHVKPQSTIFQSSRDTEVLWFS